MNKPYNPIGAQAQKQSGPSISLLLIFIAMGVVGALVAATQYVAHQYAYSPQLGAPIYAPLYAPWDFITWSFAWGDQDRDLFNQAYMIAATVLVGVFAFYALIVVVSRRRAVAHESLHGTAKWADKAEVIEAGLLPHKGEKHAGVFVGGLVERKKLLYLRHDGGEHVLAFAPTGSGKGVGLVLPTLLSWPHSLVCFDMKGENWALTAGWRQQAAENKVLRFDPADTSGRGARFNPLQEIRLGQAEEVGDAQNLATIISDPDGKGLNDHWMKTGHALLVGVILHCCYKAGDEDRIATLTDLSLFLSNPGRTLDDSLQEMVHYRHLPSGTHPAVAQAARDMLNREERERSSVHSTAVSYLTLYRDPVIKKNTEYSDFRIADLMNDQHPVSLYIVVRPSDMDRLRPLLRLIFTQIVRSLTDHMEFADGRSVAHYQHRLLLMLDEFPALGRLDVVEQALAFLRGYGIKAFIIVQDLAQLQKAYTRDESIVSSCHIRIAYAPNKVETAELLSRYTGKTTVIKQSISTSGDKHAMVLDRVTESVQEVERPLLTADECLRLPGPLKSKDGQQIIEPGDMLIMPAGFDPVYGKQVLYFRDPVLLARSKIPPPEASDRLHDGPVETRQPASGHADIDALFDNT